MPIPCNLLAQWICVPDEPRFFGCHCWKRHLTFASLSISLSLLFYSLLFIFLIILYSLYSLILYYSLSLSDSILSYSIPFYSFLFSLILFSLILFLFLSLMIFLNGIVQVITLQTFDFAGQEETLHADQTFRSHRFSLCQTVC